MERNTWGVSRSAIYVDMFLVLTAGIMLINTASRP